MSSSEQEQRDLAEVDGFLRRFDRKRIQLRNQRVEEFERRFGQVRGSWSALRDLWNEYRRLQAPELNVFEILEVQHDEARTHSRILRWLLDPRESHGQGTLLLDRFLKKCLKRPSTQEDDWRARTEIWMKGGRIDIVLSSALERRLVVIENKIYAAEQPKQLERYGEWMDSRGQFFDKHKMELVFLTIDGRKSLTAAGRRYRRLAYRDDGRDSSSPPCSDVVGWLTETARDVKPANLKEILKQYVDVLRRL